VKSPTFDNSNAQAKPILDDADCNQNVACEPLLRELKPDQQPIP
jgi:hypothetical protein